MRKFVKYFIYIFVFVFLTGCAQKYTQVPADYSAFEVINLENNQTISYDKFINELLQNDIIMLGEAHTDEYHHFMQNKIINDLYKFKNLSVVFEMLGVDKQKFIDITKKNALNLEAKELAKAIKWEKRWDYNYYKDIVESVFYSDMEFIAGNITDDEIKTIYKGAAPLNGVVSTTNEVKDKLFDIIKVSHKFNDDDNETISKMVEIQQFKDRRMADKLVHSSKLAILIAGRNHTDKTIGVPLHIIDFNKSKKFSSVGLGYECEEVEIESKNEQDYLIKFNKKENICE